MDPNPQVPKPEPQAGSDEFQRGGELTPPCEDKPLEPSLPEPEGTQPRPSRSPGGGFIVSVAMATAVLLVGLLVLYGMLGGFRPVTSEDEARPTPEVNPPPPPPPPPLDADLQILTEPELRRLAQKQREKLSLLEGQNLNLDLAVRKWKARVEEIDETFLKETLARYQAGSEEDRAAARRLLSDRGGLIAQGLLWVMENRSAAEAELREELEDWKKKAQASIQSVLRLQVRLEELKNANALEDADRFYRRGGRQSSSQEHAKALASYTRAVELNPGFDAAYHARGLVLYEMGRKEDALKDFSRASHLNAASHLYHFHCGRALADLGRRKEALEALERCLEQRPGYVQAINLVHRLEEEGGGD